MKQCTTDSLDDVVVVNSLALCSCALLYAMSLFTRGLIGFIYVSECGNWTRIAHLTFWGNRHDTIFESHRIVPMQSTNRPGSKVKRLEVEGLTKSRFKYMYNRSMRIIYDFDTFHHFFGYDRSLK
ncbi:transmembrane protein 186-like isoform X2 [Convolutriloba macropyga]|uniref:transmembrane protein 186-like isoform X2 n=1 Tax=Convolutriloba macropyga TaxID=536237 RepID=UPI003F523295